MPCPGRSLEELDLIAKYFPLMVQFYPRTFLLLVRETHGSVSDLFIRWLNWLGKRLSRKERTLSSQECYHHFEGFVQELSEQMGGFKREYLNDILRYETRSLAVAKFSDLKEVHLSG